MVRKAPMFETERPELRQEQMWNIDDVVDGFLIEKLNLEKYRRT